MKKMILATMILGLAAASVETARAGDHEWAVAGKVLTGLVAASVIAHVVEPAPACVSPRYDACLPVPAPRVVFVQPAPRALVVYRAPIRVERAPAYVVPAPVARRHVGYEYRGWHHRLHRQRR